MCRPRSTLNRYLHKLFFPLRHGRRQSWISNEIEWIRPECKTSNDPSVILSRLSVTEHQAIFALSTFLFPSITDKGLSRFHHQRRVLQIFVSFPKIAAILTFPHTTCAGSPCLFENNGHVVRCAISFPMACGLSQSSLTLFADQYYSALAFTLT